MLSIGLTTLAPKHFVIQLPYSSRHPGNFGDQQPSIFKNWKHVQQLINHVWRRLIKENLPTLIRRRKWTDNNQPILKVGDVVCTHRFDDERNLAPWKKCVNIPWTRRISTSCQVKNGSGLVRVSSRLPRTGFSL